MCGIAGIVYRDPTRLVDVQSLTDMRDMMYHRGPDGDGIFIDGNAGLAHRRLAILDLSENGKQPFCSEDGRYYITYNGEIYNYLDLKPELEMRGFAFRSNTDTEVLLYLYITYGPSMLDKLNGMFAFAVWDKLEKTLFVARDRLGVKPLYFSEWNGNFYFASEQKAILKASVPSTLNEHYFSEQLLFRFVAGEHTIFTHIERLLPGHYLLLKNSTVTVTRWWNLAEKVLANREAIPVNPFQWFEEYFASSLRYRMISDVPVGVLLSGGLDSSSVVASLSSHGFTNLSAFTVGFDEPEYNEGELAKLVANSFGFKFHEIRLKGSDLYVALKKAAWFHDEPLIHQNDAQMLAISEYAKSYVTVLLSGEASDELMGGYVRYRPLKFIKYQQLISTALAALVNITRNKRYKKLLRYYKTGSIEKMVMLNSCSLYPHDFTDMGIPVNESNSYRSKILEEAKLVYPDEPVRQAMYLDQHTFLSSLLDRNDRMTMGASIECRVPFLDYRLVEMIGAMPSSILLKGKKGKHLLFNSVAKKLPEIVRSFKKVGFAVPWEKYLTQEESFRAEVEGMHSNPVFGSSVFDGVDLKKVIREFKRNNTIYTVLLRQLFMTHMWYKEYYSKF